MRIISGIKRRPRRTMLYGVHGVGKSTFASGAPNCLFLDCEDGLNDIDCHKSERMTSFDHVMESLTFISNMEDPPSYLAIDTVDWLEKLIHKDVAAKADKTSIADIPYGNGFKQAMTYWDRLVTALDFLRTEKSIGIILLAHSDIRKFQDPESDSYDRYQPALHESASLMLQEWCDEVLFANYRTFTRKEDQGFNRERTIAVGEGDQRFIRTQETAAVKAKNRLGMPPEIGFDWNEYAAFFQTA